MDIASISAAYEGLKFGKSLLEAAYEHKAGQLSDERIREIMEKLGQAQDALFRARDDLFELQEENSQLKKKIVDVEAWERRIAKYKLVKTAGGAVVYEFEAEPQHYVCPSCVETKSIQILQDNRNYAGTYRCVLCESQYPIKPQKKPPQPRVRRGDW